MTNAEKWVLFSRMQGQMLRPRVARPLTSVVARLVGIQAQDFRWTPWIGGVRSIQATLSKATACLQAGRIVRSWVFRGTLHLVAAEDLDWLTQVIAPVVIRQNGRRYRQLELTDKDFALAIRLFGTALSHVPILSRKEARAVLEDGGLSAGGQRLPYLLQRASLEGLLRHGPDQGSRPTFVLRERRATRGGIAKSRDELIQRLSRRYLESHGPATKADLVWWSGLPSREITVALNELQENRQILHDKDLGLYWTEQEQPIRQTQSVMFLAPFDEYIVGYKDREVALEHAYSKRVNAGGGMIRPTIVQDGRIVGVWAHDHTPAGLRISPTYFDDYRTPSMSDIQAALEGLSVFLGEEVSLSPGVQDR